MTPVIDLFDSSAHQEEGSSLWWYKRVDSSGNEVRQGAVSYIKLINGGSGYTSIPQVTISGGGGSGASALAIVVHTKLAAIQITDPGMGYTSVPDIAINGVGTGAQAQAFISDGWHFGFARLKSDLDFGQDETPIYDEAKRLFACRKEELKGVLKFTSLQDDYFTESFLSKESYKYNWAIFQDAGLSRDGFRKYRYYGMVRIPRLYKSSAPGRSPDMKGILLINKDDINVNTQDLPVSGLIGSYGIAAGDGYSVQEEMSS